MKDDLNFLGNVDALHFFYSQWKTPSIFFKWKTTSIVIGIEDNCNNGYLRHIKTSRFKFFTLQNATLGFENPPSYLNIILATNSPTF